MGSVFKQKNGKSWSIQYYRNGKCYRECTHTEKKSEAEKILKLREGQIVQGHFTGLKAEKTLFDELAKDLIVDYEINARKSIDRAKLSIAHLDKFFKGCRANDISTDRINDYILQRQKQGASNGTINRELSALKRMFSLAARCTPRKVNQMPYISMLEERNVRTGFFEVTDYLKVKDALPDYLKPVFVTAYYTGMRKGEILSLTWEQFNIFEKKITLKAGTTKNDEQRVIFLVPELYELLLERKKLRDGNFSECPFIFFGKTGKQIKDFRKAWGTAFKKADIPEKWFHDNRRSAVRNMVNASIPEKTAMKISGHKTRSVFDRYNIVNEENLKDASEKLAMQIQQRKELLEEIENGHNLDIIPISSYKE